MTPKVLTLMMLILTCTLQAMGQQDVRPLSSYSFLHITSDTVSQSPTFSDDEFYSLSTSVIFKVNSIVIRPDDEFLNTFKNEILPLLNERHLQLRKVYIRGAASPEGPYANNRRLARNRSAALLRELKKSLFFQYLEPEVDINAVTEDYGYLCLLLYKADDPAYDTVKAIYDECDGDELRCKQSLMAYEGGKLWRRLLTEYFPQLRAARFILWFSEPDEKHAPVESFTPQLPQVAEPMQPASPLLGTLDVTLPPRPAAPRRHLIALRTNLLHDFFYMPRFGWAFSPNIQLEYYPLDGHYTYNAGMTWGTNRKWSSQEFWQVRDVQLEVRRYFRGGGDFSGLYLGAYAHGDKYGIGLSGSKGWQGEGGGAGLSLGYTTPLNKKGSLRLEFMAAAGFFLSVFDPYVYGNPVSGTINGDYYYEYYGNASSFKRRNHLFSWFGPTNFGVQLTYDIIFRKRNRVH